MATILDAHPGVAMCYEIYEHLIAPTEEMPDLLDRIVRELHHPPRRASAAFSFSPQVRTFMIRAERGGATRESIRAIFDAHIAASRTLDSIDDRLRIVGALGHEKAHRAAKRTWGVKIATTYEDAARFFPEGKFLFMLRDGRDVAASRMRVGDFAQTIEQVAHGWRTQLRRFTRFLEGHGTRARLVRYEQLVTEPAAELRSLLSFLELPWSDKVLEHNRQSLSIFTSPTGHLSGEQVKAPINTSSIGRFRRDLTGEQVRAFEQVAGDELERCGYPLALSATS